MDDLNKNNNNTCGSQCMRQALEIRSSFIGRDLNQQEEFAINKCRSFSGHKLLARGSLPISVGIRRYSYRG